mmetsp:Transcript_5646/g.9298  ORF Transcript_5646/g.9298 Transcript_5646/m.9298 type:complete len:301 (-) Transcript_5646:40-942(-)
MWSVDGSNIAPVMRPILSRSCILTFCITTTLCSQSNSCALRAIERATRMMSGLRDMSFCTASSMCLSSCSISVSIEDSFISARWNSIPSAINRMRGLLRVAFAPIFLCETFFRNTTPSMYTLSSMEPPGITLIFTYGRMSMLSRPPRTSGSTDDTTSRMRDTVSFFHSSIWFWMIPLEAANNLSTMATRCAEALFCNVFSLFSITSGSSWLKEPPFTPPDRAVVTGILSSSAIRSVCPSVPDKVSIELVSLPGALAPAIITGFKFRTALKSPSLLRSNNCSLHNLHDLTKPGVLNNFPSM